jgi:succinate dehydrogenase / fumarate reductase iron-sulfur subunit
MQLKFKIYRFDPETDSGPGYADYEVETEPSERILDCLNRVKWEQDGTLSYRQSCAHGVCGSCALKINGVCGLACQKLAKDYQDALVLIEPLPSFRVVKDLVVDLTPFYKKVEMVRPYLVSSGRAEQERLQSPADRKKFDDAIRCILCACCTASCPVSNEAEQFLGPSALVQAFRRIFDSRDEAKTERLRELDGPMGAWGCVNHFQCTRVCPKEIPVTKLINLTKREIKRV